MSWYAIRTLPGAQQPQREYAVEPTALGADGRPRGKGYRIVPSLNAHESAVERALGQAGFVHYMPVDFRVIRNRKKTATYSIRRFALLPGYLFVHGLEDFKRIEDVPGVLGVVGINGTPLRVSLADIIGLRTIEAKSEAKADKEIAKIRSSADSEARKTAAKALTAAKRKLSPGKQVKVLWGEHAGREATITGWADDQKVKAILSVLEGAETILIPHDHVKQAAA